VAVPAITKSEQGFEEMVFRAECAAVAVDEIEIAFARGKEKRISSRHHLLLQTHLIIPEDHAMVPREVDA